MQSRPSYATETPTTTVEGKPTIRVREMMGPPVNATNADAVHALLTALARPFKQVINS